MTTSERILEFIRSCDHSPTVREIQEAVGLSSPATVHIHLNGLRKSGLLKFVGTRIVVKDAA